MQKSASREPMAGVAARLVAFVVERYPFATTVVQKAVDAIGVDRAKLRKELARRIEIDVADVPEATPGVPSSARMAAAREELLDAIDGFLHREAIAASL